MGGGVLKVLPGPSSRALCHREWGRAQNRVCEYLREDRRWQRDAGRAASWGMPTS